jgi:hypothetical protein
MKVLGAVKAVTLLVWLGAALASSLFAGLMISAAGGAVYPELHRLGAPLACDGEFVIESRRYSSPGRVGVRQNIYCRNPATGVRAEITLRAIFVSFLVFSALTFAAITLLTLAFILVVRALSARVGAQPAFSPRAGPASGLDALLPDPVFPPPGTHSVRARRIIFNGREYASPEEMPREAREAYEAALGVFADNDGDGVPDMFEGLTRQQSQTQGDAARRLAELKGLFDAGLINAAEYEAKKAEILRSL